MKLIKFDTLYPLEYIKNKISESQSLIDSMNFNQYHQWLVDLRMNYSDFYTYNLNEYGWEAEEFFLNDDLYIEKCAKHYYGYFYILIKMFHRFRNMLSYVSIPFKERVIEKYIATRNPEVLLIREQVHVRSSFWERYKKDKLIVARIDCSIPKNWSPLSFELIYTNIPSYLEFFKSNNVPVKSNSNGFDERLLSEIIKKKKMYDVTFVGGLGEYFGFREKSLTFERLIEKLENKQTFNWWGFKTGNSFDQKFPYLTKNYKGSTGGLEMFDIYAISKIVLNDYGNGFGGIGVNQRIFEVLGTGTLLITRESESLKGWENYLVTYKDVDDCTSKIQYYLTHEEEREKIAKAGQAFVLENYSYFKLIGKLSEELQEAYKSKFSK